ncbi:MAG: TonB C-terminal domain-containing protein [Bacteriovoracaceae bacterium]|nr:TonB C-terminal domain-containing protein [Bacteriovoracaceae bacterium]
MDTLLKGLQHRDKISILVIASFAIHILLFAVFYSMGQIKLPDFLMSNKEINIRLAKASVRVDVVKMPDLTIKELKSLVQLESRGGGRPEPIVKNVAPINDEKAFLKKKKKTDFMSMLKTLSQRKVETKVKKLKSRPALKRKGPKGSKISGVMRGQLKKLLIAGNQLGSGTAIVGTGNAEVGGILDLYASTLPEHVKPHWLLPSFLMNRDLTCRVKLYLSPDGELIKAEIFESSGNDDYDLKALGAVKKSSPYPSLPDGISHFAGKGSIVLGFPL